VKAGLPRERFLQVLGETAVVSPSQKAKLENVRTNEYLPAFALRLMFKDFGLILETAMELSVPCLRRRRPCRWPPRSTPGSCPRTVTRTSRGRPSDGTVGRRSLSRRVPDPHALPRGSANAATKVTVSSPIFHSKA